MWFTLTNLAIVLPEMALDTQSNTIKLREIKTSYLESCLQVRLEGLRDRFFNLLTGKAIEGQETGLGELDQKTVIGLGLYFDDGSQFKAGFLVSLDLGNAKFNSGFITVGIFILWFPGVSVCGVAQGSPH